MKQIHEHNNCPAQFLVDNIRLLPSSGKVLDLAMGYGRNSAYLAEAGFEVDDVDISLEAVEYVLNIARKADIKINAQIADLEKDFHIMKIREAYDNIVCFSYLQRALVPEIKNSLRWGEVVVCKTYIIYQATFGEPKNYCHLLQHNELLGMFHDFRCLKYREGVFAGLIAIASILAQKVYAEHY